jgi:hypothetical protein
MELSGIEMVTPQHDAGVRGVKMDNQGLLASPKS